MNIKRGTVVSHTGAIEWGVGKVMEVTSSKATIQFSDGITRRIASSHYTILQPGDPTFFVAVAEITNVAKVRAARTPKIPKIPKEPKAPKIAKTKKPAGDQMISSQH
jgi:uncharacterized protein DUF3553